MQLGCSFEAEGLQRDFSDDGQPPSNMNLDEHPLREMLASQHGGGVGQVLVDRVEDGEPVVIAMSDGSTLTLNEPEETIRVLVERFNWRSNESRTVDWSGDRPAAYVLEVCRRVEKEFTLKEIVARISAERPDMIMEFAGAWARLVRYKMLRMLKVGDPCLYTLG